MTRLTTEIGTTSQLGRRQIAACHSQTDRALQGQNVAILFGHQLTLPDERQTELFEGRSGRAVTLATNYTTRSKVMQKRAEKT